MAVFGTSGNDQMTINGNLFTLNGLTSINPDNKSIYGGKGNDTIIVMNESKDTVDIHGEKGRDIILSSAKNNGAPSGLVLVDVDNPCGPGTLKTLATTQYISGGTQSDVMAAFHTPDVLGVQTNVFIGDSRLFSNPTNGTLAQNANDCGECGSHHSHSSRNVFLEGGHDLVHGTKTSGDVNILELRGYGWSIRLDDGHMVTASEIMGNDVNLSTMKSGVALVNLTGSSSAGENGLYTITFDHINKIHFTDGGLGGSNTSLGLVDSTDPVPATVSLTAVDTIATAKGSAYFGKDVNLNFNASNKADLIHAGDGNKTINAKNGDDTLVAGNGNQVLMGDNGSDIFSFRSDVNTALTNIYTVKGGNGDNWIDLSGFNQSSVLIHLSTGANTTVNTFTQQDVMNIAGGVSGSIKAGNATINFDHISKVIY